MRTVVKKVGNWEFIKDTYMGVTNIVNKDIKYQSLANTGWEAIEEIKSVEAMSDAEFVEHCEENYSESKIVNIAIR